MESSPTLLLRGVTRRYYGPREVVSGASLALRPGEITCLLGPSGCGKSTILRMIAGLEPVDGGEIVIRDEIMSAPGAIVPPEQRGVGLVFQDNALFPHLTVRDNVGFGVQSLAREPRERLVHDLLARFQVDHLADNWPHTLSGGEQQRVAIARALAREPFLLLLDEPFSGLDGHLRGQIRRSLVADLRAVGATVLIVTHDPDEAMMLADHLILMADGRILQSGRPEDCYDRPVSLVSARLLGEALAFPATVRDASATTPFGPMPALGMPDGEAQLIVRPKDIVIAAEGMAGEVVSVRRIGGETVTLVTAGADAFAIHSGAEGLVVGQSVHLHLRTNAPRFIPA